MNRILIILMMLLPLPLLAQGKVYKTYASRPDLTVAQVSGFKLNDTARVDVVIIQADNDGAWRALAVEFQVKDADKGVSSWLGDMEQPARRTRWTGAPALRVVASPARRTIALYLLQDEGTYDALVDYQLNAMSNPKNKKAQ